MEIVEKILAVLTPILEKIGVSVPADIVAKIEEAIQKLLKIMPF